MKYVKVVAGNSESDTLKAFKDLVVEVETGVLGFIEDNFEDKISKLQVAANPAPDGKKWNGMGVPVKLVKIDATTYNVVVRLKLKK